MLTKCPVWTRSDMPMALFSPATALVPPRVNEVRSHSQHPREPCPGPPAPLETGSQNGKEEVEVRPRVPVWTLQPYRVAYHSTLLPC